MSAEIISLPVVRVEREAPIVLRLRKRTAARLKSKARDVRMEPDELAAMLLEKILFPETSE